MFVELLLGRRGCHHDRRHRVSRLCTSALLDKGEDHSTEMSSSCRAPPRVLSLALVALLQPCSSRRRAMAPQQRPASATCRACHAGTKGHFTAHNSARSSERSSSSKGNQR